MELKAITVNVMIDGKIFRKFTVFDYIHRQRRWVSPLIFAVIMSAFASVCFAMQGSAAQAAMLGWLLLIIGLGLPSIHVWSFFDSIKKQIKAHKLEKPKHVYSLRLSGEPDGIHVTNPGGESARYKWEELYKVYRVDGCTYLYVVKNKAFLLPDGQVEEGADALWSLFANILPAGKLKNR